MMALSGRSRERLPDVELLALAERRVENVVDLVRRQGLGEQIARLADIAEQIGAGREVGGEFLHQTVERRRRDGAKPRGRARDDPQIRRIEVLEKPAPRAACPSSAAGPRPSPAR